MSHSHVSGQVGDDVTQQLSAGIDRQFAGAL